ncbi:MAG: GGDEF domain-containing protein, partial [Gammaproteobacteria bacterium]
RLIADLHQSGVSDTLTGCTSREHGLMRLDGELRRARRSKSSLMVIMLDIDTFKAVNDQYGHLVGDTVLAAVGKSLARSLRSTDVRCRYGGDEFLLVLPETSLDRAIHVADRARRAIADLAIPANGHTLRITASLGMSGIEADELDPLAVVGRADTALYEAKRGGRNQCHVAEIPKERTVSESEGLVIAASAANPARSTST